MIRAVDGCSGPIHTEQLEGLASWWETNRIYEKNDNTRNSPANSERAAVTPHERFRHPCCCPQGVGTDFCEPGKQRAAQLCRANVDLWIASFLCRMREGGRKGGKDREREKLWMLS